MFNSITHDVKPRKNRHTTTHTAATHNHKAKTRGTHAVSGAHSPQSSWQLGRMRGRGAQALSKQVMNVIENRYPVVTSRDNDMQREGRHVRGSMDNSTIYCILDMTTACNLHLKQWWWRIWKVNQGAEAMHVSIAGSNIILSIAR